MIRWFLLWVLGLIAVIGSVFLQQVLLDYRAYGDVVETAARIGWSILIFAVTALVADIIALVVYTIRHGQSDGQKGTVVIENRPLSAMSLKYPPLTGLSKRKMLGSKSEFIAMESLVNGSATFGERMMVFGIVTLFLSFFSIFLGAGLMMMKHLLILGFLPILPGLFVYYNLRDDWRYYKEAKKKFAGRHQPDQRDG